MKTMKTMIRLAAPHATLMTSPKEGQTIFEAAAESAVRHLSNGAFLMGSPKRFELRLDAFEVPDRVAERNHCTGIKSFDALLRKNQGTFMTGNVYGDAQLSQYVRAVNTTECNGQNFAPGELRDFDLKAFQRSARQSFTPVLRWLAAHQDEEVIVYGLRNKLKSSAFEPMSRWYGFLVTSVQHEKLFRHDISPSSSRVMDEAELFLTMPKLESMTPLLIIDKDGHVETFSEEMRLAFTREQEASQRNEMRERQTA